jgi:WD40 repeat protein
MRFCAIIVVLLCMQYNVDADIQYRESDWSAQLDGRINALFCLNNSFIVSDESGLHRIDYNRKVMWSYPLLSQITAITERGGLVFVSSSDGHIRILELGGKLLFERGMPGYVGFPKALDFDGELFIAGSMDGFIYAFDRDGHYIWKRSVGSYATEVKIVDETIIAVSERQVYLLDREGGVRRNLNILGSIRKAAVDDEGISVAGEDKTLSYYNLSGGLIWSMEFDRDITSLDMGSETILAATNNGGLYSLCRNGSIKYQRDLIYPVVALKAAEGYGVVSTADGRTTLLSDMGGTRWHYDVDGRTTVLDSKDNNLVAGTTRGKLHYSRVAKKDPMASTLALLVVIIVIVICAYLVLKNW